MPSELRVNFLTDSSGSGPVDFPNGLSGDGDQLEFIPRVIAFSPSSGEKEVDIELQRIVITFDRDIIFEGTGTINIRENSPSGSISTSYTLGNPPVSDGVSIVGSQLSLDLVDPLSLGTTYYVVLPNTGIADSLSPTNVYGGTDAYSFRTDTTAFRISGGTYEFVQNDVGSPTGYYRYHLFMGTSEFTVSSPVSNATDFTMLLVAGGGAGGNGGPNGGGGGGGGVLKYDETQISPLVAGTYTMTVGAGGWTSQRPSNDRLLPSPTNSYRGARWSVDLNPGPVGEPSADTKCYSGGNTSITPPTSPTTFIAKAIGGGFGGDVQNGVDQEFNLIFPAPSVANVGGSGGSGGGATSNYNNAGADNTTPGDALGGAGTPGQGFPGGGTIFGQPSGNPFVGGGGGGAGGAGGRASANGVDRTTSTDWTAGNGGPGVGVPEFNLNTLFEPGIIPFSVVPAYARSRYDGFFAGGGGGGAYEPDDLPAPTPSTIFAWRGKGGVGGGGDGYGQLPASDPDYDNGVRPGGPLGGNDVWNQAPSNEMRAQSGAFLTGGGGGGGSATFGGSGGYGGPGVALIRYAIPPNSVL
jgi:hypothetical protein